MKLLFLILPAIALSACASRPPKKIVIVPAVESSHFIPSNASICVPERIREYRFGRYVDPNDRFVMHEGHSVFRIERTNAWNLRPTGTGTTAATQSGQAPTAPLTDAALAEVNKQKAATKAFTEQAAGLNQRLAELAEGLNQTGKVATQNMLLQQSITTLQTRLDELESRVRNSAIKPSSKPHITPEENW